jgi:hypothetical protein
MEREREVKNKGSNRGGKGSVYCQESDVAYREDMITG